MLSELIQLKDAYEKGGMSLEEIAMDRSLDINAVKAGLMQSSSKYRKACGCENEEEDRLNFTNQDLEDVNAVIRNIALGSEDDHLKFKAACYIRDDKKGRKEIVKGVQNTQFNILTFNEGMARIRQQAEEAKRSINV